MSNQLKKLKKKLDRRAHESRTDKQIFEEIEQDMKPKFSQRESTSPQGVKVQLLDIPDVDGEMENEINRVTFPQLFELVERIRNEKGIEQKLVKISWAILTNKNEKELPLLFVEDDEDNDGVLVILKNE